MVYHHQPPSASLVSGIAKPDQRFFLLLFHQLPTKFQHWLKGQVSEKNYTSRETVEKINTAVIFLHVYVYLGACS